MLASLFPLVADEAYYWCWSEHPAAGYFDHPPGIAWLIALSPWDSELGVRAPSMLLLLGALATLLRHEPRAWVLLGMPAVLLGGVLATPDSPLLAWWTLALVALDRRRLLLFGLAAGGAMLSKLTGWLLLPLLLLHWREPRAWAGALLALLVASPNLAWNALNGWPAFGFQAQHLVGGEPNPHELLLGQLVLAGPLVLMAPMAWFRARRDGWWWSSLIAGLAALLASLLGRAELNWALPMWPGLAVILGRSDLRLRGLATGGGVVLALAAVAVVPWLKLPRLDLLRAAPQLVEHDWQGLPALTSRYQEAAWLRFYADVDATTVPERGRRDQFDLWPRDLSESAWFLRPARGSQELGTDLLYPRHGPIGELGPWQVVRVEGYSPSQ